MIGKATLGPQHNEYHCWTTAVGLPAFIHKMVAVSTYGWPTDTDTWYCGYVRVPEKHPMYDMSCDDIDTFYRIAVHGGITFYDPRPYDYEMDIQIVPGKYLGFDTNHGGDSPQVQDRAYCVAQCENLAKQIYDIDQKGDNDEISTDTTTQK